MNQQNILASLKSQMGFVETPISIVFFRGRTVYKVKKSVNLGFLDYTTLRKRKYFCDKEIELNRRLCPDIYLGTVPITFSQNKAVINGAGRAAEYAVKMRRLPEDSVMTKLIKRGKVSKHRINEIAAILANFYASAATSKRIAVFGKPSSIKINTDENFKQTLPFIDRVISKRSHTYIKQWTDSFLRKERELILSRIKQNFIRDCHGDLHTGNIFIPGHIFVTDCIEFNDRFRYSDQLADLAFLAMDLDYLGRQDLSLHLVEKYAQKSGDEDFNKLLIFYKVYRAFVRGKVNCFRYAQGAKSALSVAKKYFRLANQYAKS